MRFGIFCTTALAVASAALLTPALEAQTDSKQARTTITVIATSPGPGAVDLQWNGARGAVSYRIERGKVVDPGALDGRRSPVPSTQFFVVVDRHPTTSYKDTGLYPDVTYEYRVTAQFDSKTTASESASGSVTVTIAP